MKKILVFVLAILLFVGGSGLAIKQMPPNNADQKLEKVLAETPAGEITITTNVFYVEPFNKLKIVFSYGDYKGVFYFANGSSDKQVFLMIDGLRAWIAEAHDMLSENEDGLYGSYWQRQLNISGVPCMLIIEFVEDKGE